MNKRSETIILDSQPSDRIIKRAAVLAFKGVRSTFRGIRKLPAVATQATLDIRDAWQETSCPKA